MQSEGPGGEVEVCTGTFSSQLHQLLLFPSLHNTTKSKGETFPLYVIFLLLQHAAPYLWLQVTALDVEEFCNIVGGDHVLSSANDVEPYNVDWLQILR